MTTTTARLTRKGVVVERRTRTYARDRRVASLGGRLTMSAAAAFLPFVVATCVYVYVMAESAASTPWSSMFVVALICAALSTSAAGTAFVSRRVDAALNRLNDLSDISIRRDGVSTDGARVPCALDLPSDVMPTGPEVSRLRSAAAALLTGAGPADAVQAALDAAAVPAGAVRRVSDTREETT